MNVSLVVVRAFGAHLLGDVIDAANHGEDAIREILAGVHAGHVVKVAAPNTQHEEA